VQQSALARLWPWPDSTRTERAVHVITRRAEVLPQGVTTEHRAQ
jgi:hypothetical protein